MRSIAVIGATVLALAASASRSGAAELDRGRAESDTDARQYAPARAFEATIGVGYTQGFGQIARGAANNINDVANGGSAIDVGLSYRIDPTSSIGASAQYQDLGTGNTHDSSASARGAAFDVNVQLHFAPYRLVDPWLRLGTGYRMLWLAPAQTANVMWHGLDLVKVQAGLDYRAGASVAIGPMIGVDLNVFLWHRADGGASSAIADPRVSTFLYAGFQGRFDAGGHVHRAPAAVAGR